MKTRKASDITTTDVGAPGHRRGETFQSGGSRGCIERRFSFEDRRFFIFRREQPIDPLRQTLRDIHTELADLDKDAVELSAKIQGNFEELGV